MRFRRIVVAVSLLSGCVKPESTRAPDAPSTSTTASLPFSSTSPFNVPIPPSPAIDANSQAMVAYLARKKAAAAGLYEFGIPIWSAASGTAFRSIACSMSPAWGACPFASGAPVPDDAYAHTGSDGAMVVVDWANRTSYEFWQFKRTADGLSTSWGAVHSLDGTGWGGVGSSTASGASRFGGVIRISELEAGSIPHALVMSIDNSCKTTFRAPAIKTDGESERADCTPQGARLQLDPSIDLSQVAGITRGEQIVGKALQEFGAYVIDKGGAPMAISFELARDALSANQPGAAYSANGLAWDYFDLPKIPWGRLRVLHAWDGK